jgi:hypothetical protein
VINAVGFFGPMFLIAAGLAALAAALPALVHRFR